MARRKLQTNGIENIIPTGTTAADFINRDKILQAQLEIDLAKIEIMTAQECHSFICKLWNRICSKNNPYSPEITNQDIGL